MSWICPQTWTSGPGGFQILRANGIHGEIGEAADQAGRVVTNILGEGRGAGDEQVWHIPTLQITVDRAAARIGAGDDAAVVCVVWYWRRLKWSPGLRISVECDFGFIFSTISSAPVDEELRHLVFVVMPSKVMRSSGFAERVPVGWVEIEIRVLIRLYRAMRDHRGGRADSCPAPRASSQRPRPACRGEPRAAGSARPPVWPPMM